ncbi:helicase-like protein [Apiospora arundinis]
MEFDDNRGCSTSLSQSEGWASLPELPTSSEINPDWEREGDRIGASVRLNDVTRAYASKEDYLEIHYSLQREDGVANLRKAVSDYKLFPGMMDDDDNCVYTKVFVKGYHITTQGPLCRISFSTERAGKKIRWTNTRRLTPGTIVALSSDGFQQCKVASIVERFMEGPTWADLNDAVFDPMEELVMLESRHGFYEAIRHSLIGLQHVATTDSPLTKYLVSGSRIDATPEYVQDCPTMDITPLLSPELQPHDAIIEAFKNANIIDGIPSDIEPYTSLDDSQLQAVHRILTKELAIVQGPPGTGKTFTSVQALKILIQSHDVPIIVAAETNHAVDQILKQLVDQGLGSMVVRLGGRTKDAGLREHSLHNLRERGRIFDPMDDSDNRHATKSFGNIYGALAKNKKKFRELVNDVFTDRLLDPVYLYEQGIITKDQLDRFLEEDWGDEEMDIMRDWLGESLCHTSDIRRFRDPMFDIEEIRQEDEVDGIGVEMEEDGLGDDFDPVGRLKGDWIEIDRLYGGSNVHGYLESDIALKRQLCKSLWNIDQKFRGAIYEHWHKRLVKKHESEFRDILANNMRLAKNLKSNRRLKDAQLIKKMQIKIVGCTITGLSKYRELIASLQPRTILVEEAAQSREAQITAALLPSLQQLVLVGDHQQLAPYCSIPLLAEDPHFLCTSMFERLVEYMRLPFTVLEVQRRMIPEIRQVLSPFYKRLRDHPMVEDPLHRPPIPGMKHPLYFCHHNYPEGFDSELNSMFNIEEAEHVVRFAEYLMRNGTPIDGITILTFYRGQRTRILREAGRRDISGLKVNTVDSYQGEENDVILLSLVRSSAPGNMYRAGFVEDEHRGVVSISRARRGFYIFGNYINLENATYKSNAMWQRVRNQFQKGGFFDEKKPGLPIYCEKHNRSIHMDDAESWEGNHGGCFQKCSGTFACGHPCELCCHPMPHDKLRCNAPCERRLRCGHACKMGCGDRCCCAVDCRAFYGIVSPPPPPPTAQQIQNTQAWQGFDARADDRHLAALQGLDGAAEECETTTLIDTFRPVTLSPRRGIRNVGAAISSSSSVSPNKSTETSSDVKPLPPTQNKPNKQSKPKKPKAPAIRGRGDRRRVPAPVLPPPVLTLDARGADYEEDSSPTIAEWERHDEDEGEEKITDVSVVAAQKASDESKNLIDLD